MGKKASKRWLKERGYKIKHNYGPFFIILENKKVIERKMNLTEMNLRDLEILNSPLIKALR